MGHDQVAGGSPPQDTDAIADRGPVRPLDWTGSGDPTSPHDEAAGAEAPQAERPAQTPPVGHAMDRPAADANPADTATLAADAAADLQGIAQAEVQLAKTELAGEARTAAAGAGAITAGAVAGLLGGLFALLGLTELLARWMPRWAAAGLVGGALAASGAGLVLGGKERLASIRPPVETVRTLKENGTWIRTLGRRATKS